MRAFVKRARDLARVGEAVAATAASLTRPAAEFAYNAGGGHPVYVNEALDRMERVTGWRIARRDLGCRPRTGLEEGLAREWQWQRNR